MCSRTIVYFKLGLKWLSLLGFTGYRRHETARRESNSVVARRVDPFSCSRCSAPSCAHKGARQARNAIHHHRAHTTHSVYHPQHAHPTAPPCAGMVLTEFRAAWCRNGRPGDPCAPVSAGTRACRRAPCSRPWQTRQLLRRGAHPTREQPVQTDVLSARGQVCAGAAVVRCVPVPVALGALGCARRPGST